jgi:4-amino-4-deoxy-L-arabinose transferase-like glycosyltransferase
MRGACDIGMERSRRGKVGVPWLMVAILLLASSLVWHDLGTREVIGRDENATLTKLDQPDWGAVLRSTTLRVAGLPSNTQPLYFLLQYPLWPLVARNAFVLRFLPSLFGILAIALTFKLGEVLWSPEAGLIGSFFTALLPLSVRYAQIARPYSLLLALSLASAYFLILALKTDRILAWAGFVLTAALSFYTQYTALMVLAAEGVFGALVLTANALTRRRPPRRLLRPALSFVLLAGLCAPGLLRLASASELAGGGEVPVELTIGFLRQFLYNIGLHAAWRQILVLALMVFGLAAGLYRRRWLPVLFTILLVVIPFLILTVVKSSRPFAVRYVIFVPPVAVLAAGYAVMVLADITADLAQRWAGPHALRNLRLPAIIALSIGVALLFVSPLARFYDSHRAEERIDLAVAVIERYAQPGDLIVISPRFFVRPLEANGAQVLYLTEHLPPSQLDQLLAQHNRMWLLFSSFLPPQELQEPLDQWYHEHQEQFARIMIKRISAIAYHNGSLYDDEALLKDRIAMLEGWAGTGTERRESRQRGGVLGTAYEDLSELYAERGMLDLAEAYRAKAEEARIAYEDQ